MPPTGGGNPATVNCVLVTFTLDMTYTPLNIPGVPTLLLTPVMVTSSPAVGCTAGVLVTLKSYVAMPFTSIAALLMSITLLARACSTVQVLSQDAFTPCMVRLPPALKPGMATAVVTVASVCCQCPVLPVFSASPQCCPPTALEEPYAISNHGTGWCSPKPGMAVPVLVTWYVPLPMVVAVGHAAVLTMYTYAVPYAAMVSTRLWFSGAFALP